MSDSIKLTITNTKREVLSKDELKKHEERLLEEKEEEAARQERARIRTEMDSLRGGTKGEGSGGGDGAAAGADRAQVVTAAMKNTNERFSAEVFLKFSTTVDSLTFPVYVEEPNGFGGADKGLKVSTSVAITGKDIVENDMTDYGYPVDPSTLHDMVSGMDTSTESARKIISPELMASMKLVHLTMEQKEEIGWTKEKRGKKRELVEVEEDQEEVEYEAAEAELREGRGIITGRNGKPTMKLAPSALVVDVVAEVLVVPCGETMDGATARPILRGAGGNANVILVGSGGEDVDGAGDETTRG
jgi:hypothetical protein